MDILSKYQIVKESGHSYKAVCEECGRKALYITPHNGLAYCFVCGYTEKFGKHEPELFYNDDINLDEVVEAYETFYRSCTELPDSAYLYLLNRGLKQETIKKFGFVYCPSRVLQNPLFRKYKLTNAHGIPYLSERIIIPYFYDNRIINLRGRDFQGKEPKYKGAPSPARKYFFYPFNWVEATKRADQEGYIIVTEGELKAVAAHEHGYPVCAVSGIRNIPPGLSFKKHWRVIFAFDNEIENHVSQALRSISRWYKNIFVAILPRLGRAKMDIDELIRIGRLDLFQLAIQQAMPVDSYLKLVGV